VNLEDLIDDKGLQQDEWSLTRPMFGEEDQLKVVGWSGRQQSSKLYILKCTKCSQDSELFGEGYFKSQKGNLIAGKVPCGCAKSFRWSREQYEILCSRKSTSIGCKFLSFGGWEGVYTKVTLLCRKHGKWSTGDVNKLINMGVGCPGCKADNISDANTKLDSVMIKSFLASEAFHPDTKFWRSERETTQGKKNYWYVSCPECGETGESMSSHLQKGQRPCVCSKHRQQEGYINFVVDNDYIVAIKFGIARDSKQRIKNQNRQCVYEIHNYQVYTFPSVAGCKKAERECLQELECGVVLKRDMPDGYTETTWYYNLEKIIQIYERNGGKES